MNKLVGPRELWSFLGLTWNNFQLEIPFAANGRPVYNVGMDDKTKLYVFAKKEIFLIFVFMLLISLTSFMVGIKVGKNTGLLNAGYTPEDRQRVDILSGQEEAVEKILDEKKSEPSRPVDVNKVNQSLEEKLRQELEEVESNPKAPVEVVAPPPVVNEVHAATETKPRQDLYAGKYTIQLGSHRALKDAEDFAQGFKVRGYSPIITEVELTGRGIWYRVSLGVFSSVAEAKDYILKEKTLFQGQDYVIGRFD
jgi:hypothetical protein